MAIDATVGGASANSYVTLAEAVAYMADRYPSTSWDDASESSREAALVTAAQRLDQEAFRGVPVKPLTGTSNEPTQALKWPRQSVVNDEGWVYLDTIIPERVKRAQMKLAYFFLSGDITLAQSGLEQFHRAKVGPLEVEVRHAKRAGSLPEDVLREIRSLMVGGAVTVPLVRS